MAEMYLIYVIYLVLYLFESFYWIPKNSVILYFSKRKNAKLYFSSELFCDQKNSLALSSVLFPFRLFSVLPIPQISISEKHLFAYAISSLKERQVQDVYESYKFSEIEKINTDDSELLINDKVFVKFYSSTQAKFWEDSVTGLLHLSQQERSVKINLLLDGFFDRQAIVDKIETFTQETKLLRVLNSILLLVLITNASATFFVSWFMDYFWYSVVALYTLSSLSGIAFYLAQKKLTTIKKSKRIFSALKMMFYPPSTIGSVSELSTHMFSEFHPLAVLYELSDKSTFEKFAGQYLRDLLFPLAQTYPLGDSYFKESEEVWRIRLIEKTKQFLLENNIAINQLLQPNQTDDDESSYYCPRCLTLYNKALENCSDCYGVKPLKIS